jgi:tetratricopeptide (TPR) repeat protein
MLCSDPEVGASELERLDRQWTGVVRPEDRSALTTVLQELEDSRLIDGRARVWSLITIGWTLDTRGEVAQLAEIAAEALRLACRAGDKSAEAEASCLNGDVFRARGQLVPAREAYDRFLSIRRTLAEQAPSDADRQRELAVAYSRVGGVLQAQDQLAAAQAAFDQSLAIGLRLAEQDPINAGWLRELAVAYGRVGGVLRAQGQLVGAQSAFGQDLALSQRLVEQDPSNAAWQRGLALAYSRTGDVLQAQGQLVQAQAAFDQHLRISLRLAEQDPSNANWRRGLAEAYSQIGDVLQAQGQLAAARAAFDQCLAIFQRLTSQDPSNADWQRDLEAAYRRVGSVLQAEGRPESAQAALVQAQMISDHLAGQDLSNTGWLADGAEAPGGLAAAQAAFEERQAISERPEEQGLGNTGWRPDVAVALSGIGGTSQTLVQLPERRAGRGPTYNERHFLLGELSGDEIDTDSALWARSRSEVTQEQYNEFYHHVGHAFDDPWLTLHAKAEGVLEYTSLLFVPSAQPVDLFDPERKSRVKLYVRRVFITDEGTNLLPAYLRFLRGVVDSEDLPLNISRGALQSNPIVTRIRQQLTKRILTEIGKKASEAPEEYIKFWENFGAVLKEGLYEDREHRDDLLAIARFHSTLRDGLISLDDYVTAMKPGQETIYTITGDSLDVIRQSPQLEGFLARGVEVLLMTDPIDEFWVPAIGSYTDKPFKSATRGGADLDKISLPEDRKGEQTEPPAKLARLIAIFKLALGDAVKDVRSSDRLTDSAVCLVADEGDMDMHFERLLKQHRRLDTTSKRILELNPRHKLIERLAATVGEAGASDQLSEFAWLLLDQARIIEGEQLSDATAFARRLSTALERWLSAVA